MSESNEKDVRTQMLEVLTKYNIKQVDVATEADIHHSTLSLWLQGKVKGHHIKIQDTITKWLSSFYSGRPRYTTLNKTIDKQFILTPAATNVSLKRPVDADQTVLIPIHFDLQLEGKRYKEQFCWNINDPSLTPEEFAHFLVCENATLTHFEAQIRDTIRKAISSYRESKHQGGSCLKVLELDVKVENVCLKDRFEWDINDETNNPEDFAYLLVKELKLSYEFMAKIAHQIREQLEYYRKNYQLNAKTETVNRPDGNARNESDSGTNMMQLKKSTRNLISLSGNDSNRQPEPQVTSSDYLRRKGQEWEPKMQMLDPGQVRKFQKLQERQNRYARRTR